MSLINQVLHHIEQRHAVSPAAETPWATQVKPVLQVQDTPVRRWYLRPWFWLTVMACVFAIIERQQLLQGWQKWHQQQPGAAVVSPMVTAVPPGWRQQWDGRPQLSKSLSSDWQSMALSKKTAEPMPPDHDSKQDKPVIETTIPTRAAELTNASVPEAVTETLKPVADNSNPSEKAMASPAGTTRGEVIKQMKPEQEANVLIQRALDQAQKGRSNEAVATLRQTLAQFPQSEEARLLLASQLFENRQENEAVALLQAGIASHPEQHGLRKALARWQLAHAQPEAVLATLKPMLNAAGQDAEWQWMMAMAYQQTGQHAFAIPYFDQALKLQAGQAQWYVASAMSLQALGQLSAALHQLQMAQNLPMSERMADFVAQRIQQLSATTN